MIGNLPPLHSHGVTPHGGTTFQTLLQLAIWYSSSHCKVQLHNLCTNAASALPAWHACKVHSSSMPQWAWCRHQRQPCAGWPAQHRQKAPSTTSWHRNLISKRNFLTDWHMLLDGQEYSCHAQGMIPPSKPDMQRLQRAVDTA